jgi:hypothetical protein
VLGQLLNVHDLSIATRVRCEPGAIGRRAAKRTVVRNPGALGACRGREAPWYALRKPYTR